MKIISRFYVSGIALFLIVLAGVAGFSYATLSGPELAQKVYDRPDGKTMSMKLTMILQRTGNQPRQRQFFSYRKDLDDGKIKSLIRFTQPNDVRDTGMLTHNQPDGENNQWLYLPEASMVRRIAGERKGGRFVGSDMYYEDLQDRKTDKDNHVFLREEEWNGAATYVLESTPVDASNSSYSKRVLWVHPETMIPVRIDFFRHGGDEPIKRLTVSKIDQVQGFWTVMESKIEDLSKDHHTIIRVEAVEYDKDLPERLFSRSILEDTSLERGYRP